jgi:hypothetical protein
MALYSDYFCRKLARGSQTGSHCWLDGVRPPTKYTMAKSDIPFGGFADFFVREYTQCTWQFHRQKYASKCIKIRNIGVMLIIFFRKLARGSQTGSHCADAARPPIKYVISKSDNTFAGLENLLSGKTHNVHVGFINILCN